VAKTLKIINGDIVRATTNAQYYTVTDKEKVSQDVKETLTTRVNPLTGLGASLDEVIGHDSSNPASTYSYTPPLYEFQSRVDSALTRLQAAQGAYLLSERTARELISDISAVQIWKIKDDPRNFKWRVRVMTYYGRDSFAVGGITGGV
jgi:hypothetical protein